MITLLKPDLSGSYAIYRLYNQNLLLDIVANFYFHRSRLESSLVCVFRSFNFQVSMLRGKC